MMVRAMLSLWPHVRNFRYRFLAGIFLIICSMLIEVLLPIVVGKNVDAVMLPANARQELIFWCLVYLGMIFLRAVLDSAQGYTLQSTGHAVTHELRSVLFGKTLSLKVAYYDKNPTGRLLTRVINDIKTLGELFTASISVLALDALIIMGTVVAMFWVNWYLAAWVLATFPAVLFVIHFSGKRLAEAYRVVRLHLGEINAFLGENIGAISTIQRLSAEGPRMEKFSKVVGEHQAAQMRQLKTFAIVQPLTNLLNGTATATLLLVAGREIVAGRMSLGVLVAFLGYLRNLFQPIRDLVEKYNTFLSAGVSAERVAGLLAEESETVGPVSNRASGTADIVFNEVSFTYPTREEKALEKVSFKVPAGASYAVVGATGSGKSTLIRLLLRFYEPTDGKVLVGGKPIEDWSLYELRHLFGVIHQEVYLFNSTVRENLTLGAREFKDEYLIEQCKKAQVWDLLQARGGLDAIIQENGTNLSLGEKQLLSFARTLVFDPPVLVLDEATANIDRVGERKIMEAIDSMMAGRTSLVIAHRLSTIRKCDQLLVLEQGKLVQQGTYDELIATPGLFKDFHDLHEFA